MDRRRARRIVARGMLALVGVVLAWAASGALAAFALTRRSHPRFEEPARAPFTGLRLRSSDGLTIGAWIAERDDERAAVVLVHGNGASRSQLIGEARWFYDRGCTVLLISVRAHGDSDGDSNDIGWSARHDVVAAVDRLGERRIIVYGTSLGAAAALYAAPELGDRVRAYVLVAPFADLRDATRARTERYLPTPLDLVAYGALRVGGRFVLPDIDRMRPIEGAAHIPRGVRVLAFAGGADERAPAADVRRIARAAHGRAIVVPGIDHEDLGQLVARPEWDREVPALLDSLADR